MLSEQVLQRLGRNTRSFCNRGDRQGLFDPFFHNPDGALHTGFPFRDIAERHERLRIRLRMRGFDWSNAVFLTLGKLPEAQGVLTYAGRRILRRQARLIEYKG